MAGVIEFTEDIAWSAAGWVYNAILEDLAEILRTSQPDLAEVLLESRTEVNGGFAILHHLSPSALATLVAAIHSLRDHYETQGDSSFDDPEFYAGFLEEVVQLSQVATSFQQGRSRSGQ